MNTFVMLCLAELLTGATAGEGDRTRRESPLLRDPHAFLAEIDATSLLSAPAAEPQDLSRYQDRYGVTEARPLHPDTGQFVKPTPADTWLYFAMGPYRGPRNNVWHSLFNTPAIEEALALPAKTWHPYLTIDMTNSDWSNDDGGPSRHRTSYASQMLGLDYAISGWFLVGLRFNMGELGEGDDETVRVFQNNQQIVPNGSRGFAPESLVLRGKGVFSFQSVDFGGLVEVKIPLAGEEDLLTAQTLDIGVSAIASKRWRRFAIHANAGVVVPTGDAKVFTVNDEVQPYLHGGVAASWMAFNTFSFFAQVEFNTSAFKELDIIDDNVLAVLIGGRYKMGRNVFMTGAIGTGLNEQSGELILSTGIDMTF